MWVEPLENGKFKFCERYTDPLTGKTKKVSVTLAKDNKYTRKDAAAILQEKIEAASTPALKHEKLTLDELCKLYIEFQTRTVTPGTVRRNEATLHTVCEKLNPAALVANLNAGYINTYLFHKDEKPCTKNERLRRFKALIRWGYNNDYIADIRWLDKLKPVNDKEAKEKLEHKFLERSELHALLDAMTIPLWKDLTRFMALTGTRIGEAMALTASDIDFKTNNISVNKTIDVIIKDVHSPKTMCSNREVFMQPELEALCKDLKQGINLKRFQTGVKTQLLFSNINGDYINYYSYNKYLGEISEKVLGRKITTHVLRHTHVSLLAEAGVPLETITRRVGHEDSTITRKIYLHVTERMKERDKALLARVNMLA